MRWEISALPAKVKYTFLRLTLDGDIKTLSIKMTKFHSSTRKCKSWRTSKLQLRTSTKWIIGFVARCHMLKKLLFARLLLFLSYGRLLIAEKDDEDRLENGKILLGGNAAWKLRRRWKHSKNEKKKRDWKILSSRWCCEKCLWLRKEIRINKRKNILRKSHV